MNKTIGVLARFGLGPGYIHLLRVRGRTTGRIYSTPVNLFRFRGRRYLVGGRGHTAWSRNALAAGVVTLARGSNSCEYRVSAVTDEKKPEILKGYLEEYPKTVQRFFSVAAGSPIEAFRQVAGLHPVFELTETGKSSMDSGARSRQRR
jgi:deazaflavin-dependent oxidoreductase (nitroreductase family)